MSRERRYLVWAVALVGGAFLLLLLLLPGNVDVALDQRRSSLRTTPEGLAGLSRSLEAWGRRPVPRFDSYTAASPTGAVQVLVEPRIQPSAGEAAVVLEWVRSGGLLVYSPPAPTPLADSLGVDLRYDDTGSWVQLADHRWTRWVVPSDMIHFWGLTRTDTTTTWTPLVQVRGSDDPLVTLAWREVGGGGVLLLGPGETVSNEYLAHSTEAVILARALLELSPEGSIVEFSEYHQGFDGGSGVVSRLAGLLLDSPPGRVVLHLLFVGGILAMVGGRRLGRPVEEDVPDRRSPREHVEALARIYRTAGGREAAARRLIRGAARRRGTTLPASRDAELAFIRRVDASPSPSEGDDLSRWDLVALAGLLDDLHPHHR